tara:strand:- start:1841 stop:3442 length:1602 start_codon:yes stop_codon:yes gene_type:complete
MLSGFKSYIERNGFDVKPHQTEGVQWLLDIEEKGERLGSQTIKSGILADEMGLGKTIQILGLCLENFKAHTLIVLPRALLEQWASTIRSTLGHTALVYHGTSKRGVGVAELSSAPIVLTTYGQVAEKGGALKYGRLHSITWDRVIFDEGHHLRNRNTRNHKAAVALRCESKWLVTGTPIQNSITDFYGLCAVMGINQKYFMNKENTYKIINHVLLKRTKAGVGIQLPALRRNVVEVKWSSPEEKQFAADIHAHLSFSNVMNNNPNNLYMNLGLHHFAMLQRARQSCINSELMERSLKSLQRLEVIPKDFDISVLNGYQSKLDAVLKEIEERKDNGRAKLIFCHYHLEIDKMVEYLSGMGLRTKKFDGRTFQTNREEILTSGEVDALVLQIKTGCEGLNLQHFSEVYFVSPHWNPAVEDQAVARCHRIGQESEVDVMSFKMEAFDDDNMTRSMDKYVKDIQFVKRGDMRIIDGEPEVPGAVLVDGDGEKKVCAICLKDQHEHTHTRLECGHCYHTQCIQSAREHGHHRCPLCRK